MKFILSLSLLIVHSTYSQVVTLDNSFGNNGLVLVPQTTRINKILITDENKILSVGYSQPTSTYIPQVTISRHYTNGDIDTDFGINGVAQHQINYTSEAKDAILQEDGKILVIGTTETTSNGNEVYGFISRYHPNGDVDSSFATNGIFTSVNNYDLFHSIFLNLDGSILISGNTNNGGTLMKLSPDGVIDSNYGVNGIVELSFNGFHFVNYDAIKLSDGNLLFTGFEASGNNKISCQKRTLEGDLITSFGQNGRFILDADIDSSLNWEYLDQAAERFDGKIALSGHGDGYVLILINENGTIDSNFGNNGMVNLITENKDILIQEDNKVITGYGLLMGPNNHEIRLNRFTSEGLPDPTFNSTGNFSLDLTPYNDEMFSFEFIDSTHVILGGTSPDSNYSNNCFLLARLDISETVSLIELSDYKHFIYPNPASKFLYIEGSSPKKIRIQNQLGQMILEKNYNSESGIDLSELSPGTYIISYATESGTSTNKFVKY